MMPGPMVTRHLLPGVMDPAGAALMKHASSLSLSVHYGSKERVDFALGMQDADGANALATAIRGPAHLLPAAEELHSRLEDVSVRGNEVRGSVLVAGREFDPWLAALSSRAASGASEQTVAQVSAAR